MISWSKCVVAMSAGSNLSRRGEMLHLSGADAHSIIVLVVAKDHIDTKEIFIILAVILIC